MNKLQQKNFKNKILPKALSNSKKQIKQNFDLKKKLINKTSFKITKHYKKLKEKVQKIQKLNTYESFSILL